MRRMYSKKQLEKLISELSGDLIEVTNIKQLSDEECNGLKVGDIVAKKTGEQYHCYIVTFKQDKGGLCLSYFDASVIETQSYDYTEGHWVYNSEDKTEFSQIGGGLPEVTAEDNEKVLEVIAGQWGKGGKKVNVMDAPTSTTLTNEQYNKIREGVFINGNFLGFKNPVLFPSNDYTYSALGVIIGKDPNTSLPDTIITLYAINLSTKTIKVVGQILDFLPSDYYGNANPVLKIYGKAFPFYPPNNEIGQLIFRKGALVWYKPVAQSNITSGDVIALDSDLGKALLDHLEVEINGFRARYEYIDGNYIVYSSKAEANGGLKLQVNMISYNTTNGELSFNQMTFTPDA